MSGLVACFIPCCQSKDGRGSIKDLSYIWPPNDEIWSRISSYRDKIKDTVVFDNDVEASALKLYTGNIYKVHNLKEEAEKIIRAGRMRLFIISAVYGIVDASERINEYNKEMKGGIARKWNIYGLTDLIADLCISLKPDQIYGFFTGKSTWNKFDNNTKYRYFFTAGVQKALKSIPSSLLFPPSCEHTRKCVSTRFKDFRPTEKRLAYAQYH